VPSRTPRRARAKRGRILSHRHGRDGRKPNRIVSRTCAIVRHLYVFRCIAVYVAVLRFPLPGRKWPSDGSHVRKIRNEKVTGSNPVSSTPRTRLEPLPTSILVAVRALSASAAQVSALALTCGSSSISKGRLCSTRSSLSSSMKTLVKKAWLHSRRFVSSQRA
jgi:hypothetical protein